MQVSKQVRDVRDKPPLLPFFIVRTDSSKVMLCRDTKWSLCVIAAGYGCTYVLLLVDYASIVLPVSDSRMANLKRGI